MTKTLREKVDAARLHANDHAYDKQREFDDADRLSDLGDDVKRLDGRIDELQTVINFHGATNEEQDAAIDVLTDELHQFQERVRVMLGAFEKRFDEKIESLQLQIIFPESHND